MYMNTVNDRGKYLAWQVKDWLLGIQAHMGKREYTVCLNFHPISPKKQKHQAG